MRIINSTSDFKVRLLTQSDVSLDYLGWFSDEQVTRYSDNQYKIFKLEDQLRYVERCAADPDIDLYGIFCGECHIGNISVSGLTSTHRRAELAYVIGNKRYWGRGAASFAISQVVIMATQVYGLRKLFAGVASANHASRAVLERNAFSIEGVRREHLFYNGKFYDQIDYGRLL